MPFFHIIPYISAIKSYMAGQSGSIINGLLVMFLIAAHPFDIILFYHILYVHTYIKFYYIIPSKICLIMPVLAAQPIELFHNL